ncbi:ABC transporter permease [Yoonia litorea]|uniref:ABC-type polysaccharide/polyol phosphate export permease n=1 Tax=Yoonia litorea TaxID=1123755 RepID=A0A1I6MV93_9RHOB|nr:ABC transporter permease [Yoonia litorea]SFS19625.1 ABC-type polysaccharide/polyol phosphate export permease [Yoonia litorea]
MFQTNRIHRNKVSSFFGIVSVIYHTIVQNIRGGHRNAIVGILVVIMRSVILVGVFFVMFQLIGVRTSPIRGDFILYIMTGIFLYLTHVMTVRQLAQAVSPTSPSMMHSPMNTVISFIATTFSMLYQKTLAIGIMLLAYHLLINPITIDKPIGAYGMLLLAWGSGCAVGLIFGVLTPWFPNAMPLLMQFYIRANMIASGKMFLANSLPATMVAWFDWNPLFHAIDQARGFAFLHYTPMNSQIAYPVILTMVLLLIGFMAEFFSRQHASVSWFAAR